MKRKDCRAYYSIFQLFFEVTFPRLTLACSGILTSKKERNLRTLKWGMKLKKLRLKLAPKIRIFEAHFEKILRNLRLSKKARSL